MLVEHPGSPPRAHRACHAGLVRPPDAPIACLWLMASFGLMGSSARLPVYASSRRAPARQKSHNGLKRPKHHFMSHLALDVWRFGPPHGYWCFGFESFNKVIKAGAQRTNWRDTTYSIMQYWSVRSARAMLREKRVVTQTV